MTCGLVTFVVVASGLLVSFVLVTINPEWLVVQVDECLKYEGDPAVARTLLEAKEKKPLGLVALSPNEACGANNSESGGNYLRFGYTKLTSPEHDRIEWFQRWREARSAEHFQMVGYSQSFTYHAVPDLAIWIAICSLITMWVLSEVLRSGPLIASQLGWKRILSNAAVGAVLGAFAVVGLEFATEEAPPTAHLFEALASSSYLMILFLVFMFPVIEERRFRGRLLAVFPSNNLGRVIGLLVTAGIFASLHSVTPLLNPVVWTTLFLASISFGIGYLLTRDWRYPAIQHSAYNLTLVVIGYGTS